MQVPNTAKVILCGEYGVGKSSLFRRFSTNTFTTKVCQLRVIGFCLKLITKYEPLSSSEPAEKLLHLMRYILFIQSGPSSTIGLDHFAKEYQFGRGDAIILDLWDTGGNVVHDFEVKRGGSGVNFLWSLFHHHSILNIQIRNFWSRYGARRHDHVQLLQTRDCRYFSLWQIKSLLSLLTSSSPPRSRHARRLQC